MDASSVDPTHKTDPPDPVEDNACKEDLKPTNENETISNTVSTSENIDNNEGNIVESLNTRAMRTIQNTAAVVIQNTAAVVIQSIVRGISCTKVGFFVDYKKWYEEALYKLSELCKDQTTTDQTKNRKLQSTPLKTS